MVSHDSTNYLDHVEDRILWDVIEVVEIKVGLRLNTFATSKRSFSNNSSDPK